MKLLLLTLIFLFSTLNYSQSKSNEKMKYLALGDSYTIGEGVAVSDRFPVQLAFQLNDAGINIEDPDIIAVSGWTTDELSAGIDKKEPVGQYDLATLLIGVNNQYRGRDAKEFRNEFAQLLNRAAGFTTSIKNVIVVSIPDWGVTPFAVKMGRDPQKVSNEIELYNSIVKEEAEKAGAHFVNITDLSNKATDDRSLLVEDKLHPSGKMYSLWVERIFPIAQKILEVK